MAPREGSDALPIAFCVHTNSPASARGRITSLWHHGGDNVIAFRIYAGGGSAGIVHGPVTVGFARENPAPAYRTRGDLSADGRVTVEDVVTALRIAAGLLHATPDQLAAGDLVAPHDRIDVADVVALMRGIAGRGGL